MPILLVHGNGLPGAEQYYPFYSVYGFERSKLAVLMAFWVNAPGT